jgi:hypothetical protein
MGPDLSERQWGIVREDYSENGNAWDYFTHEQSHSRAYHWGEEGLDNIGVFDRSSPLPTGGYLKQADGTAWMALFSLNMLEIALELVTHDPTYAEMVIKFVHHFVSIASCTRTT